MIRTSSPSSVPPHLPASVTSPADGGYLEAVYAGVLGKIIGVYLGRPVENWTYDRIAAEIGEVDYYIHEKRGRKLVITDDDISGTFTFLRALEDYEFDPELRSEQIGQTWLNYLIENTTILWWGGLGNSTEHTAYLRLKQGIKAPSSGSAELNSLAVAEQIGAQIFIDGWGLICPGDPERAAKFAKAAARVSHDGEAVHGAVVMATLVSAAFAVKDIGEMLDIALDHIPGDCIIARLISDLRLWRSQTDDWRVARMKLEQEYGYTRFAGQCPVVPNHGVIILALLFGGGDFDLSLKIANTAGWDTDCNSGNVGAILGVRNGLAGMEGRDWRGPVADRLYMPSADGGRSITDALRESVVVANMGRILASLPPLRPKDGARFHFSQKGSTQGWMVEDAANGQAVNDQGGLRLSHKSGRDPLRVATPTFIPPEVKDLVTGYVLVANPTLYSGHLVVANFKSAVGDGRARFYVEHYNEVDGTDRVYSHTFDVSDSEKQICWRVPSLGGFPIHALGIELESGSITLDSLTWDGVPATEWPVVGGTMWARAWASSLDRFQPVRDGFRYMVKNAGRGFLTQGAREWGDYEMTCQIVPRLAVACGVVVRYQGLKRYYAIVLSRDGVMRIEKELDGRSILAEIPFPHELNQPLDLRVQVRGSTVTVWVDGKEVVKVADAGRVLTGGALGFVVEEGCFGAEVPAVRPL